LTLKKALVKKYSAELHLALDAVKNCGLAIGDGS
jgi:hypothetical protein